VFDYSFGLKNKVNNYIGKDSFFCTSSIFLLILSDWKANFDCW